MNILLCGSWDDAERDDWAQALRAALPAPHRLLLQRGEVDDALIDIALVANPPPGALQGLPGLRLIQSLWAGVDRLLADPSVPAHVPLARMVDPAMNAAMAETVLWAVLSLQRGFFGYARQQVARRWQQHRQWRADEVPVLLLGHGQMGRAAAQRLSAMGFAVTAWSRGHDVDAGRWPGVDAGREPIVGADKAPLPGPHPPPVRSIHGDAALGPAAAAARIVVNLLPLTAATQGVLGAPLFAHLPRGAGIVNLARGGHLIEADLLAALDSGQIEHAVLDVFHQEPLPPEHPFWRHERITVLPHVAALTDVHSASTVALANVQAVAQGGQIAHRVWRERGY